MDPISVIAGLATTILNKVWGNKDDELKRQFISEFQKELNRVELQKAQIDVNVAEANNPNRKWVTWRELLGYVLVLAVTWQWVLMPFISYVALLVNHPVDISKLPDFNVVDMLYIMLGMLGLDATPIITNRFKRK